MRNVPLMFDAVLVGGVVWALAVSVAASQNTDTVTPAGPPISPAAASHSDQVDEVAPSAESEVAAIEDVAAEAAAAPSPSLGPAPSDPNARPSEVSPPGVRNPLDRAWGRDENPGNPPLCNFGLSTPGTLTIIGATGVSEFCNAVDFVGSDFSKLYMLTGDKFYRIDTATGAATLIGTATPPSNHVWTGMSYNPADGHLYVLSADLSGAGGQIHRMNLTTGQPTFVVSHMVPRAISLAINCQGQAFTHSIDSDNLISLNLANGTNTPIGPLGFDASFGQGMDFDDSDGTLYMAAYNQGAAPGSRAELRTVNTSTGATTLVGAIDPGTAAQLGSLAIQETCGGFVGACCDQRNGVCTDYVSAPNCIGPERVFYPNSTCDTLAPPCAAYRTIAYQGFLASNGVPVNGATDFRFQLHDAAIGGNPVGLASLTPGVAVADGLFTARPRFDADLFAGQPLWLQIEVAHPSGNPNFTPLADRQPLDATPHAIFSDYAAVAGAVAGGVSWAQLTGVPAGFADGIDNIGATSWAELTGIPAGFADGVDNGGDGHSLDASDGSPLNALVVDPNGNVAIGYNAGPALADLHVVGDPNIGTLLLGPSVEGVVNFGLSRLTLAGDFTGLGRGMQFEFSGSERVLRVRGNSPVSTHITVRELAPTRVGIGVSDPNLVTQTLTVGGVVRSSTGGFQLPDGTVIDAAADLGTGDITAVNAGAGLTGGGASGDVTLSANFAGNGAASTVARSDHYHSTLAASDGAPLNAATVDAAGNIGIGEAAPLARLHVSNGDAGVTGAALENDDFIVEAEDATLGLYSTQSGSWSSAIALKELLGGVLIDTWGIARRASDATNPSSLHFTYGPSNNYATNPAFMVLTNTGNVGIGATTPTAKLHVGGVAGTDGIRYPDGTLQTTAAPEIIKLAVAVDPPSLNSLAGANVAVTVTGAAVGDAVVANPGGSLSTGYVLTFARVSAADTVTLGFYNATGAALNPSSTTWQFRVIK